LLFCYTFGMKDRIVIPKQIVMLTALAVGLNIVRLVWSDSLYFIYLLWNIFLAFLPFAVSSLLLWYRRHQQMPAIFFVVFGAVWLFLFPNAPYLVTDIIHLSPYSLVPMWYDALLLFSTAWVGMLLAFHSLSHMEELILTKYSKKVSSVLVLLIIFCASYGIYIGRFLRWNSWDLVFRPHLLGGDVWQVLLHPVLNVEAYAFTIFFFIFIGISYRAWKAS